MGIDFELDVVAPFRNLFHNFDLLTLALMN